MIWREGSIEEWYAMLIGVASACSYGNEHGAPAWDGHVCLSYVVWSSRC